MREPKVSTKLVREQIILEIEANRISIEEGQRIIQSLGLVSIEEEYNKNSIPVHFLNDFIELLEQYKAHISFTNYVEIFNTPWVVSFRGGKYNINGYFEKYPYPCDITVDSLKVIKKHFSECEVTGNFIPIDEEYFKKIFQPLFTLTAKEVEIMKEALLYTKGAYDGKITLGLGGFRNFEDYKQSSIDMTNILDRIKAFQDENSRT